MVADGRTGGGVIEGVAERLHEFTHIGIAVRAYQAELTGVVTVAITAGGFLIVISHELDTHLGIGSHDTTGFRAVRIDITTLQIDVPACHVIHAGDGIFLRRIDQEIRHRHTRSAFFTGCEHDHPAVLVLRELIHILIQITGFHTPYIHHNSILRDIGCLGHEAVSIDRVGGLEVVAVRALVEGLYGPCPRAIFGHRGHLGRTADVERRIELAVAEESDHVAVRLGRDIPGERHIIAACHFGMHVGRFVIINAYGEA